MITLEIDKEKAHYAKEKIAKADLAQQVECKIGIPEVSIPKSEIKNPKSKTSFISF